MMAETVMGNTDSQYMMGAGKSSTTGGDGPNDTGLTTSANFYISCDANGVNVSNESIVF